MNYILLDLEWNNAYFPKLRKSFNEIVEFGAIKLNENFEEIDRFNIIVRSSITKKLSGRFKELTGMTNEIMLEGVPFKMALERYKKWAGENIITLTWSNTDLFVLYDNCEHFTSGVDNAKLGLYVDLQQYFHYELELLGKPEKNQISLSNAAALFNISFEDGNLHHAVDDSIISAKILKKCFNQDHFNKFVVNTNNSHFYEKLRFKAFYINNLKSELIDKSQMYFNCPICYKRAKRLTKWKLKNHRFASTFFCNNCNKKFVGFISFRKLYDRVEIKKKVNTLADATVKAEIK